ncbi:DUF7344 domain-containing protein [Haloarcula litorea]|uniref:DUF7344 domain-containing protein n=1 Tax=Haloarcula litorea TaxID=3032579 RepID=UPI0023E8096E|nr:hypothetical protein [Halomicroarcula sp. GDY20]
MSSQVAQSSAGSTTALSKGEIFDVLQNERRRYVLQYLRQNGGPVELGDLASHVASMEYDCDSSDVSSAQRKRVYTTLQQTHLPRMDETGIVDYDDEDGVIATTEQTEELTVYLEIVPGSEFPWREYYLSFSAVSLAVVVVLWVGVYPFTLVPPLVWATVMAVVLAGSALYHNVAGREMTLTEYVDEQAEE